MQAAAHHHEDVLEVQGTGTVGFGETGEVLSSPATASERRPATKCGPLFTNKVEDSEVLKRSNKGKNACETSCRVRSVPRSFNELHYVAVMSGKWPRYGLPTSPF